MLGAWAFLQPTVRAVSTLRTNSVSLGRRTRFVCNVQVAFSDLFFRVRTVIIPLRSAREECAAKGVEGCRT
jgi:hypothetical protein